MPPADGAAAPAFVRRRLQVKVLDARIGRDYPAPIVEHGAVRERTLSAYKDAQASA